MPIDFWGKRPRETATEPTAPESSGPIFALPPAGSRGLVPSASEVARIMSGLEMRHETYIIQTSDTIEECFAHVQMVAGLVYIHGGDDNGALADATATCYLGRLRKFLTEQRLVGDQTVPYIYPETQGSERQSARLYVRGAAGTHVLLVYR